MSNGNPDLGEQALNATAEVALSSQLDEVQKLEVDIDTDPGKLMQGKIDTLEIEGQGLVMEKDLRMEELSMQVNNIAINPLSALGGKIELTEPGNGRAKAVLTEADLNRALASDYLSDKVRSLQIEVEGKPVTLETKDIQCRLLNDSKIALDTQVLRSDIGEVQSVSFTAKPQVLTGGTGVVLEDIQYAEGKELPPEFTKAIVNKVADILNLRSFDLEGMTLRIDRLHIKSGQLILNAQAHISKLPA
ncbi:MAG: DUF2993 domain-containing protein [Desertifilum sp.]|nr:DUF2993 domain-containing protein [Desertifilum sp.]